MRRACLLLLIVLAFAASAHGQQAGGQEAARASYKHAVTDFDAGRFEVALQEFRSVIEQIGGSPNARLYVARCLRQLGRLPEAYAEMALTAREAADRATAEPRFEPTRQAAVEELGELRAEVALVTVVVLDPPSDLSATLNGRPLEPIELGQATAVMPGVVQIRASAPGRRPAERRLTLPAGDSETVTLTLPAPAEASTAAASSSAAAPPPSGAATAGAAAGPRTGEAEEPAAGGGGLGPRGWGFITAGLGLAGMGVFIGAGVAANQRYDEISTVCNGRSCPDPSHHDGIETGRTLDTVANTALGIGLAGLVAGAVLILVGGEPEPSPPVAVHGGARSMTARWVF